MIIYNLFPLLAGKFTNWEKHLLRASEMGFNWVFVNPIQRPGTSGSLYSIADYYDFNPLLVDKRIRKAPGQQAKEAMAAAEKMGLKMMVDLVINHCSVDSDLIQLHPEWFSWEAKGRVAHPFCLENGKKVVWKDLAKFDHRNTRDKEGLFQFFLDVVNFLIKLGFKGFRCDAAYQIPQSLWKRLIGETKRVHPDVLFFAETLGCPADRTRKTAGAGFDYIFNSSKWWDFHSYWLMEQYDLTRDIAPSVSFPESHDTMRLCEELDGNIEGLKQRYLFSAMFSAGVMMPMGYEFGFRRKLHVVKTGPEDWEETNINLVSFITTVNKIKAEHAIFQEEAPTEILYHDNPHVLPMWKASISTKEESLLIFNKDIHSKQPFYAESLQEFIQAGAPLVDVSPEYAMDYIPVPFSYDLRPGQGMVLITSRNLALED
ncbi:MAG: alpha-amylase [Desulfobacterales bacterium]|nr:alpha-amylase [Desulfobacterales bacterium]